MTSVPQTLRHAAAPFPVVWRRLCDRWRSRAQAPPAGPEPDAIAVADDPAQRVADAETARALGDALEEAWPRLTRKELQAVVLNYRHVLPQADIAGILKIGAPRVTRLLQSAMRRLRASIEARLGVGALGAGSADAWAEVGDTVDRILARAAADVGDTASRRSVDG